VDAELPEFIQRQECGSTETVSEAPGVYGIHSHSRTIWIASYETASALASWPIPDHAVLWAEVPLVQVSRHVVVSTDASGTSWGAMCNGHAASGFWIGPRLHWHIHLPRVASSMACSAASVASVKNHSCSLGVLMPE